MEKNEKRGNGKRNETDEKTKGRDTRRKKDKEIEWHEGKFVG